MIDSIEIIDKREDVNPDVVQTTSIYTKVGGAINDGFTTVSAQGSSRSAKTYNILLFLILYCIFHARTRLSIVRATLPSLKGSVFIDFKEILYRLGVFNEKSLNKSELIYTFPNGSWVEFFSTDSEQKIRGRKRDILYCNEANELKFLEWQQLKMRTTKFAIIDYNPSFTDDHWLCGVNKDERTHHFISTYKDNPFLEQTIIDEIESLQHKNKSLWQVYGLGQQAMIEGLIFENINIVKEIPRWVKTSYIGLDFGFTQDPTAIVKVSFYENKVYIDEVCYKTKMLSNDIIQELKPLKNYRVISESADPRLVQEIYNAGVNIHPVTKGVGSIMEGITKMLEYEINITEHSINIIKEFKNYTYQQDKNEKWLNVPIDSYNHAIDATRYVFLEQILGKNRRKKNLTGIFY